MKVRNPNWQTPRAQVIPDKRDAMLSALDYDEMRQCQAGLNIGEFDSTTPAQPSPQHSWASAVSAIETLVQIYTEEQPDEAEYLWSAWQTILRGV